MKNLKVLGIDLAKNTFHVHGYDASWKTVVSKNMNRNKLKIFISNLPKCTIGMEACGGSHYWAREFKNMGHDVKLVAPQYVTPFVRGNKTDRRDAQAIADCISRPEMKLVAVKTIHQQEIAALHRVRSRLVASRTALMNEMRGLLHEFGIVIPTGRLHLESALQEHAADADNNFGADFRALLLDSYSELQELNERICSLEEKISALANTSEVCKRMMQVPGVGPTIATALLAHIGDAKVFKNGREMSAYLGLVPKQNSTGGKTVLLGISKRGDKTIRTLLIHGARSIVRFSEGKKDKLRQWVNQIDNRRGRNKACVALANKNARILWAIMATGKEYKIPEIVAA